MFYPLRRFLDDRYAKFLTMANGGALLVLWVMTLLFAQPQETQLLLHYAIDYGVNLVGPWHYVYRVAILGSMVAIINIFLAYILFRIEKRYSYVLLSAAVAVLVLLVIALSVIILLNT